jgi:hypothetical protein
MINDKDVHIQVYSECDGHSIQVLNADADRVLHSSSWSHNNEELGAGGEKNFVELLKYLGYTVYNEEVY